MTTATSTALDADFHDDCRRLVENMEEAIKGKTDVLRLVVVCLLAEGHLLIEDVPGVGKTSIARALADSVDGRFKRIQFTPDLLPSDVTGTAMLTKDNTFLFGEGPVFANIVLADEINRASPRTQSALLEAMEEDQVTVAGATHDLPYPFMVVATQNPVEMRGTHPLPEAQLDRFLMRIRVDYPDREAERAILRLHTGDDTTVLRPVVNVARVGRLIRQCAHVHVDHSIHDYVIDIAEATRRSDHVALGVSPRGCLSLVRAAQAHAALDGRSFVVPEDVDTLAMSVLAHRLLLHPEARRRGLHPTTVIEELVRATPVPPAAASA